MIILTLINLIYWAFLILFIARMIISFARVSPYDPTWGRIVELVYRITEPILQPVRNLIPSQGGLDLSPLIILFGIIILREMIRGIIF